MGLNKGLKVGMALGRRLGKGTPSSQKRRTQKTNAARKTPLCCTYCDSPVLDETWKRVMHCINNQDCCDGCIATEREDLQAKKWKEAATTTVEIKDMCAHSKESLPVGRTTYQLAMRKLKPIRAEKRGNLVKRKKKF